jgi:hypothetical protein
MKFIALNQEFRSSGVAEGGNEERRKTENRKQNSEWGSEASVGDVRLHKAA